MEKPKLRWGILGTANIARKNWKAIWNSGNGIITAVGSRHVERSGRFVAECQAHAPFGEAPKTLGTYEELIADPGVDALYVPLPTGVRREWVLRAAAAGKHIVCEKPCAISVADLEEMLETCRRNRVQFMDGVMFMHSARLERIRQAINDCNTIGRIKRITTAFSFGASAEFFTSNIRAQSSLEPHGCLGDLGWYCIRFALWAMDRRLPRWVTGRTLTQHPPEAPPSRSSGRGAAIANSSTAKKKAAAFEFTLPANPAAVPTEFSGELFFDGGVSSSFYCSFITELQQTAEISGTSGYLRVPDFVLPFHGSELGFETTNSTYKVNGLDFVLDPNLRRWTVEEPSNSLPTAQEANLFCNFAAQVQSGTLNPAWPEMALKTQQVMEACRESARVQGQPVEL